MTRILNETRQSGGLLSPAISGNQSFTLIIPPGEVFHSSRVTVLSSDPWSDAALTSQPATGQTDPSSLVVKWRCNRLLGVRYQVEAFSCLPDQRLLTGKSSVTSQQTGFIPSQHGFHFDNSFPAVPDRIIKTPFGNLPIGNAANGLCGGMVYAALDYFTARLPIPPETVAPASGGLFDALVNRLIDSFDLPAGILKYVEWMNPNYPDHQTFLSKFFGGLNGRPWCMLRQEWPVIKTRLDAGQPCPLGLVRLLSKELKDLGQNHQVMAYGYDLNGSGLALYIYDPNYHDNDGITLQLSTADPQHPTPVTYSTGEAVYCFFHTAYAFVMPLQ
jgi:hypothetical protein